MSGDRDVRAARGYLDKVRSRSVESLPPSVLAREDAELRRLLRIVLDVLEDYEHIELDYEVTQLTLYGALLIGLSDVSTLMDALADAADCGEQHEPVSASPARSAIYRELAARIGGQQ
jgi:hypothetical protein